VISETDIKDTGNALIDFTAKLYAVLNDLRCDLDKLTENVNGYYHNPGIGKDCLLARVRRLTAAVYGPFPWEQERPWRDEEEV
jgi:hypothetical protein